MRKSPLLQNKARVRVRFAPSPTGHLHVGGARTALFNWLFARKTGGIFVLRLEDTDVQRSTDESARGILDALRWLGLHWDEGPGIDGPYAPYRQSLRAVLYRTEVDRLLREQHAYRCFCAVETLQDMRQGSAGGVTAHQYDGRCARLAGAVSDSRAAAGESHVVRLRMPRDRELAWADLVRGELSFQADHLDDFVLLRSDGHPTYNFAVVVDDAKMHITHVIRGDDHISNTPRQLALFDALGFQRPEIAHLPMIVGSDKTRLSKRHGATSATHYREQGILPEAMVNYLALLGWALDGKHEVFSLSDLVTHFDLAKVSKTAAVFDVQKLLWMNGEHFARLGFGQKINVLLPQMKRHGLWPPEFRVDLNAGPHLRVVTGAAGSKIAGSITPMSEEEWVRSEPSLAEEMPRLKLILDALGNRLGGPHDVADVMRYFYSEHFPYETAAVEKYMRGAEVARRLEALATRLEALQPFTAASVEESLRQLAVQLGIKAAQLIHPARVALTGQAVSPSIFDVLYLLGRSKAVERLRRGAGIIEHDRELPAPHGP